MRHIMISKLALIMLCAVPMSACGDEGAGQQPAAAKAKPASVPAAVPALDPKFLGQWEERTKSNTPEFGDVTMTLNKITFAKIGSAQMTVHEDYVSLKWDGNSKNVLCSEGNKPEAAIISLFNYGTNNSNPDLDITFFGKEFYFEGRPAFEGFRTTLNVCVSGNWKKPQLDKK
jgi:hypothetical protein